MFPHLGKSNVRKNPSTVAFYRSCFWGWEIPSPSHHHVYRWYVYHSQSWVVYGIVLPTLSQTQERGWHRPHPPSIMEGSHCQTQSVTQWPCPPIGKILIHNIKKNSFGWPARKWRKKAWTDFYLLWLKIALLENGVYTWYIPGHGHRNLG